MVTVMTTWMTPKRRHARSMRILRNANRAVRFLGWLLLFGIAAYVLSQPAKAETYWMVPTTRDLSIGAGASAAFRFTKTINNVGRVDWIAIKNDCVSTLYFDFRNQADAAGLRYPIRLNGLVSGNASQAAQSFTGPFVVHVVTVSNDSTTQACTFTMTAGEKVSQ